MRGPSFSRLSLAILTLFFLQTSAAAQTEPPLVRRLALVVGNNDYDHLPDLRKAVGDAEAMQDALTKLGFSVTLVRNASHAVLSEALDAFAAQIEQNDEVVFHFSGHGVAVNGRNYLLPTDMREPRPGQDLTLYRRGFDAHVEVEALRAQQPKYVFVVLDACRDNPFQVFRSAGMTRGLAAMPVNIGAFVIFSAGEGETALDRLGNDDREPTSVFMRVFLKHVSRPGLIFETLASTVKDEVRDLAFRRGGRHQQFPDYKNRTVGALSLNPLRVRSPDQPAQPAQPPTPSPALSGDACYALAMTDRDDEALKNCMRNYSSHPRLAEAIAALARRDKRDFDDAVGARTAAALEGYIRRRPVGEYVDEARQMLAVGDFVDRPKPCAVGTVAVMVGAAGVEKKTCLKPGEGRTESFRDCAECPEMVVVPAETFQMGSPENEPQRETNEARHSVRIPQPFAVGKYEVTFDQWDACVRDGGCGGHNPNDQGWGRGSLPVVDVSWSHAQAYVQWISQKTGKTYRLLSEAEWEYSARAGTQTPFWWGSTITTNQANYDGNYPYNNGPKGEYRQRTVPVNSFAANRWGLFQVHGNVWEWVEDCWNDNYTSKPSDIKLNGGPWTTGNCGLRVLRGGSWFNNARNLRAAVRNGVGTESRSGWVGFRLARTL